MKKFIAISLLVLSHVSNASACAGEWNTHNYYMMSLMPRQTEELFKKETDAFWEKYINSKEEYFWFRMTDAKEAAQGKGDKPMMQYLEYLSEYLEICDQLRETWSYPTKEQLAQRKQTLSRIANACSLYQGQSWRPQYALMAMRARMLQGKHQANIEFWNNKASKFPASVYRDMMRNIYAGALLHTGQKRQAWNIFVEQGDVNSIKWSVRKFRNLAGIKSIYAEQPDAPALRYLVQDFVNSVQETYDQGPKPDEEWIRELGANPGYAKEISQFIVFANQVAGKNNCPDPCMWKTAVAMLQYLSNKQADAQNSIDAAIKLKSTERSADVARCIRMLISTKTAQLTPSYSTYASEELKWLDSKIATNDNEEDCYFRHAKERIVYRGLAPRLKEIGRTDLALALTGTFETFEKGKDYNSSYQGEYYYNMEEYNADKLAAYFDYLKSAPDSPLEQYAINNNTIDVNYANDFVATKLIAEGRFSEAIKRLELIPLKFIEGQNISWYMANRDYTKARWMGRQFPPKDEYVDGPNNGKITLNKKLQYCHDMVQLESQYKLATGQDRQQKAYDLAVRYYQASYKGDCWFLTHYGQSISDTASVKEKDFVATAHSLLEESAKSSNATLRLNSLYALAFDPQNSWCDYDWSTEQYVPIRTRQQYKALARLDEYVQQNPSNLPRYVTKCDVLKQFRKLR